MIFSSYSCELPRPWTPQQPRSQWRCIRRAMMCFAKREINGICSGCTKKNNIPVKGKRAYGDRNSYPRESLKKNVYFCASISYRLFLRCIKKKNNNKLFLTQFNAMPIDFTNKLIELLKIVPSTFQIDFSVPLWFAMEEKAARFYRNSVKTRSAFIRIRLFFSFHEFQWNSLRNATKTIHHKKLANFSQELRAFYFQKQRVAREIVIFSTETFSDWNWIYSFFPRPSINKFFTLIYAEKKSDIFLSS